MDIYQALTKDHNELKPLLDRLVAMSQVNSDTKTTLQAINDALIPHSRAEESVFYNALRETEEGKGILTHSYREHMAAEVMLRTLQGLEIFNTEWEMLARKLRESLLHHIEEEEGEIFARAREVFMEDEAEQMGAAFLRAKEISAEQGDVKNMLDMVVNMMPPRITKMMKSHETHAH